ncbi:hypothetical protein MRB53_033066 [Persea americana]|uniref:Uncharacterized protein n=1 Tax=Persea americana TaxID=3435 RepID=A0ACC2KTG1_PERAE|nr:hypothetical protein MRB53_033066 [Persea americana]
MEVISTNIIIEIQPIKNTANDSLLGHGLLDKRKLISEHVDASQLAAAREYGPLEIWLVSAGSVVLVHLISSTNVDASQLTASREDCPAPNPTHPAVYSLQHRRFDFRVGSFLLEAEVISSTSLFLFIFLSKYREQVPLNPIQLCCCCRYGNANVWKTFTDLFDYFPLTALKQRLETKDIHFVWCRPT